MEAPPTCLRSGERRRPITLNIGRRASRLRLRLGLGRRAKVHRSERVWPRICELGRRRQRPAGVGERAQVEEKPQVVRSWLREKAIERERDAPFARERQQWIRSRLSSEWLARSGGGSGSRGGNSGQPTWSRRVGRSGALARLSLSLPV